MKKVETNYHKLIVTDVLINIVYSINIIIMGDSNDWGIIPFALLNLAIQLIYMIIHGIVTYCVYRKVFYPHLITGIIIGISTIFLLICPDVDKDLVYVSSIYFCGFFIISLIVSFITRLGFKLCARKTYQSGDG